MSYNTGTLFKSLLFIISKTVLGSLDIEFIEIYRYLIVYVSLRKKIDPS